MRKFRRSKYYCLKCKDNHFYDSDIGKEHLNRVIKQQIHTTKPIELDNLHTVNNELDQVYKLISDRKQSIETGKIDISQYLLTNELDKLRLQLNKLETDETKQQQLEIIYNTMRDMQMTLDTYMFLVNNPSTQKHSKYSKNNDNFINSNIYKLKLQIDNVKQTNSEN